MIRILILLLLFALPLMVRADVAGVFNPKNYGTTTWGQGSPFTWTFDAGTDDPKFIFGDNETEFSGINGYNFFANAGLDILSYSYAGTSTFTQHSANGERGSEAALAETNKIGRWRTSGYDGTSYRTTSEIRAVVDGTVDTGIIPTILEFLTLNNSGSLGVRMTLKGDGLYVANKITGSQITVSSSVQSAIFRSPGGASVDQGIFRLANLEEICWRNFGETGDNCLTSNASDQLAYNGSPIGGSGDNITVNGTAATDANFLDNIYTAFAINVASNPDDITSKFVYNAASGNHALLANEGAFAANGFVFEGATADNVETYIQVTDPTATDKTFTIPNADSVAVVPDAGSANNFLTAISTAGAISKAQPASSNLSDASNIALLNGNPTTFTTNVQSPIFRSNISDPADSGIFRLGNDETVCWEHNPTGTDDCLKVGVANTLLFNGAPIGGGAGDIETVGSCTSGECAIEGGTDIFPFIYEGTANDFETTFTVTDPTTPDKTITFPNLTGTVALSANKLDFFSGTTSAELAGVISDEVGTGKVIYDTNAIFQTSVTIPTGTNPTVDAAGEIAEDTSAPGQLLYGSAPNVLVALDSKCIVLTSLDATDDNRLMFSFPYAVTVTGVWCHYEGSAPTTAANFTLDSGGTGMTITGTNPTCAAPTSAATIAAVTANNSVTAGVPVRFSTTNTPNPATDTYELCLRYTVNRL